MPFLFHILMTPFFTFLLGLGCGLVYINDPLPSICMPLKQANECWCPSRIAKPVNTAMPTNTAMPANAAMLTNTAMPENNFMPMFRIS